MSNSVTATSPPPPSAFSHFVSLAESSAAVTTKNSRHSKRASSAGPRPLHLAAGSIVGSVPTSPARTASPLFAEEGPATSPYSPRAGPSTPLSPTISGLRNSSSRRQSSISYKASGAHSPSPSQSSFGGKRDSVDIGNFLGAARSPLSGNTAAFCEPAASGLTRSSSLGAKRVNRVKVVAEQPPRTSVDGTERAPVTLAEKHAELLHFIAQKESKCLELRSQLAVHEAELLELKKKWERIVNRGFERSQNGMSGKPSSSPTSASNLGPTFTTSKSDSSSVNNASYFPTLIPAPNAPSAIVLEGIKEGVQGVSRLLAAGLETIAQVNAPTTPTETHVKRAITPEPSTTATSARSAPTHPATVLPRKSGQGHEQKESQSSTTSTASNASMASSLLSVSTTSSATSATPSEGLGGGLTTPTSGKHAETESDSEFGAFEEARTTSGKRKDEQEHEVLMVRDTGATPTMSPNPDFQRRTLHPSEVDDAFDWDDGWGNLDGDKDQEESLEVSAVQTVETPSGHPEPTGTTGVASNVSSAAAAQQMTSWVGSMGKKWGEIKGSQTFTKSQKRATLILSDMQQSLVSALISPTPLSASERSSTQPSPASSLTSPSSSLPSPFSSNASRRDSSILAQTSVRTATSAGMSRAPPPSHSELSLLDDSDESFGEEAEDTVRLTMSAPVMVPTAAPNKPVRQGAMNNSHMANGRHSATSVATKPDVDEDEWNW